MPKTLRIVLGDQLSSSISSLQDIDPKEDCILMTELLHEATHVKHHKKKLVLIFSAMRHFAKECEEKKWKVHYSYLNQSQKNETFTSHIKKAIETLKPKKVIITKPSEYRVLEHIQALQNEFKDLVECREDDRFLCTQAEFSEWANSQKSHLKMEFFYRQMRQKYAVLMNGNAPIGDKWNFDHENRKVPSKNTSIPKPLRIESNELTKSVIKDVNTYFPDHFGHTDDFHFATTRTDALRILSHFINERLPNFGTYQDAMLVNEPWLFHSHISFYLNCGLLTPLECIEVAEKAYHEKKAPLNSVEGFIRQILGWREFIRGIYWQHMPNYKNLNALQAKQKLPKFYWDGKTKMNCIHHSVKQTIDHAYAHHIQRLMVLGNFALISGIHPDEVNEWFYIVYADAYEWVELPNVSGMSLYADGGIFATKPYASGGSYINKMSNYCKNCHFSVKEKTGESACPFNYLYWNFIATHYETFKKNPRMAMMCRVYDKMNMEQKKMIEKSSQNFLKTLY